MLKGTGVQRRCYWMPVRAEVPFSIYLITEAVADHTACRIRAIMAH